MKKLYFLFFAFLITSSFYGQVIISELADPTNDAGARYVEIYCIGPGSVDLTNWELRRWTNAGTDPQASGIDLTSLGTLNVGDYAIIAANGTQFQTVFGLNADISAGTGGAADSNGDDKIAILDNNDVIVDIFGTPGNDSNNANTAENFEDGRAERKSSVNAPNNVWDSSEWNTDNDQGFGSGAQSAPSDFDPGIWIGDSNACGVTLEMANYTCSSNTIGDNNDSVIIEIPYTGSDAGIMSISSTSAGTIGGNNPSTTVDGIITITGLMEGDSWDIELVGGNCNSNSISGTVPSDVCDPLPNSCFDISNGMELFEIATVATNSESDEWQYSSGTYSVNGFCGGGCQELVDTWLIFGPLDMTSVSDLSLFFEASEGFSGTDLTVNYSSSYSGCPSGTSWTVAQTISSSGSYEIDLSSLSGASVYLGINYNDDGIDGYSSWSLIDVSLGSFGSCPILGSRPTSDCALCDIVLEAENYICSTNTAGADNDSLTVEIPYTGLESTITSVTTSSSGSVGGDDPSLVSNGTITITGLSEGDSWDITLNGGDCDGTSISGTIGSNICDPISCSNPGDIIFTEIMQNPAANSDPTGEYVELYNTTGSAINMQGWIIRDDVNTSETHTISSMLIIPAMGYIVIGNVATTTPSLHYSYGNDISLGNGIDGIIIECSSTIIDQVIWDDGNTFPDPNGASMELSTTAMNSTDNDNGSNWGTAISDLGNGDFGTPGAGNDFTLSIKHNQIQGFNFTPNPTALGYVDFTSRSNSTMTVKVYDILGKQVINDTVENNRLDVSNLKSGVYILKATQDNAVSTKKLVIQ